MLRKTAKKNDGTRIKPKPLPPFVAARRMMRRWRSQPRRRITSTVDEIAAMTPPAPGSVVRTSPGIFEFAGVATGRFPHGMGETIRECSASYAVQSRSRQACPNYAELDAKIAATLGPNESIRRCMDELIVQLSRDHNQRAEERARMVMNTILGEDLNGVPYTREELMTARIVEPEPCGTHCAPNPDWVTPKVREEIRLTTVPDCETLT